LLPLVGAASEHVFFADNAAPGTVILRDGRSAPLTSSTYRPLSETTVKTPENMPVRTSLVVPDASLVALLAEDSDLYLAAMQVSAAPERIATLETRLRRGTAQFDVVTRNTDLVVLTATAEIRARAPFSFEVRVIPPPIDQTRIAVLEGKVTARSLAVKADVAVVGPREVWESARLTAEKKFFALAEPPAAGADFDTLAESLSIASTARYNEATAAGSPAVAPLTATPDPTSAVSPTVAGPR
jgi:hypothetical protein